MDKPLPNDYFLDAHDFLDELLEIWNTSKTDDAMLFNVRLQESFYAFVAKAEKQWDERQKAICQALS